ncbi:MAG: two-component regulator propeller domain-containing protein [Ginsengibacter sp.]
MNKTEASSHRLPAIIIILIIFSSCNNTADTPFPEKQLGYSQPVTTPLVFSVAKKLNWDTAKKGGITPVIQKLDIDALPSIPYDSMGFRSFAQSAQEVRFDFNSLPGADFNLDKLPSKPLELKTFVLNPPALLKVSPPAPQKGKPLAIYDFGLAQGFQGKFIGALYKDHNGLLWIGGREGLFYYDGEHLQTFIAGSATFPPISGIVEDKAGNIWFVQAGSTNIGVIDRHNGIVSYSNRIWGVKNNISKMTLDEKGNIWLYNANDKSISIIDPIVRTYKDINNKTGLSDSTAFQVLEDNKKNIWITTITGGVDIIDVSSGKIRYLRKANGLSNDTVTAIAIDKSGSVWLATADGLNAIDVKNGNIKYYNQSQGIGHNYTFGLYFDDKGLLWRTTNNGIELTDVENKKTKHINKPDGLSADVVIALSPDIYNRIWLSSVEGGGVLGSTQGLNIIDQNGATVHPLGTTQIISLMEDAVSNLWVATQKGIYIVNPQRNAMRLLDKSNGLSDNFVQSFWKKNGNMVVATDGGFNLIDPVHKTILKAGRKEGLVSDTIYVAFSDNAGNIWLTGPSNGIDMVDSAKKITFHTNVAGGLNDNNIQDVKQDNDGSIWLATNTNGIDIIDPLKGTVKYLNNQPGLKDLCNRMLLKDKYGRMWIGTDKGIYIANTKNNTLTNISTKQGLANNTVLSLLEYNGSVVAGTNNKVNVITAPAPGDSDGQWKISLLDKSQNLIKETSSWSTDCITANGEYLWGDNGITVIHGIKATDDSTATLITGMNIMTQPQYFINKSGVGQKDTIRTADTFYIGKLPENWSASGSFAWDSVSGPYNLPINLYIPHNKNYVQFQFTQANSGRQDTTFYSYILEGIDKNWSAVTTNPYTENYLNLPAGKYSFKVRSKGIDGFWGRPAEFNFTITPPWYQTWWAYTIYLFLGISILRGYIVYRSRKLKTENRILEEKVAHRTNQLKQSIEDLKSTQSQLIQSEKMASLGELTAGIAHEIQNPLNFVNNFSEVNIELTDELKEELNKSSLSAGEKSSIENITDDIRSNQEKINFHGKRADAIVKGMLQHSRSSNGQKEPTNINALADEYLRLAYHGLRAKDKSFNATMKTDFDDSIGKIKIVSQDVGRVILNLITNAFYAVTEKKRAMQATEETVPYEPTVTVSTKFVKTPAGGMDVLISVKDNGNGVPQKVLDKIFQPFFTTKPAGIGTGLGLSLSYDIIKAHGGELKVKTGDGEGAEFTIILPG